MAERAFAVVAQPMKRKTATSPRSASWTLYDPRVLAAKLGVDLLLVEAALEETGYAKAVHIREELIRWKERLRAEERDLQKEIKELERVRAEKRNRLGRAQEQLANIRNLLRLPREHLGLTGD